MPPIAIVADTGCDLPPAVLARYNIGQVSLTARFGEYELLDTPESRNEFWDLYDISQPPQSAGPSIGAWADAYEIALQGAEEVIAITLTSKHSSTYNSAVIAAEQFAGRVHVFDSWSLSLAEGMLTLHAAQMAEGGHTTDEILAELTSWRQRLRVFILLDTIESLQRGGRAATIMAAIKRVSGSVLYPANLDSQRGCNLVGWRRPQPEKRLQAYHQQPGWTPGRGAGHSAYPQP